MGLGPLPLELEIPSDVGCIESVVAQIVRCCEDEAFADRHLAFHIPVALTEALSNAILRGNGEDASKSVRVRVSVDSHALIVEVEDDGLGFDLDACTLDPTTHENLGREDGRGLFLMRRLMDHVEQFRARGNVVRMVLLRRSSDDRAA
jgi:serine/threonine-protein kinase RsbW